MDKYTLPILPSTQHVLEDLANPEIHQSDKQDSSKTAMTTEDALQKAQCCYQIFRQLEGDLISQKDLNRKLEELNHKLIENIDNMKKQT